ncbi:MAG: hypothetical protein K1X55_06835 [Chitinophagales bacterium]|nr:hypothetical protein [Chitinophagales bacterium]
MRQWLIGLLILALSFSCKKEGEENLANTHPYKGTVRIYETKRNLSLKYYDNGTSAGLYFSLGSEELLEFMPGAKANQYYIRPKDHPEWCLDYSTKNDISIKLYPYLGNDAQLFNIIEKGDGNIFIQCVADTSLYLLNNSDNLSIGPSSYLRPRNSYLATYPGTLDYWKIEQL